MLCWFTRQMKLVAQALSIARTAYIRAAARNPLLAAALLFVALLVTPAQAAAGEPVILVFGDSLSAEYGLARGTGWAALLEARLKQKRIPYSVVNASISGETTSGGAARIDLALKQHKPAIIIIELGGNDGLRGLALDATRANFTRMIEASKQAGAKVLLAGMQLPPNYGRSYTEGFRTLYADLAQRHKTALVPFFLDGISERRELFQADGIHPVAGAQPRLLDNVWSLLAPLLSTPKPGAGHTGKPR